MANETTNKFMVLKSDYFIQKIFEHIERKLSIVIVKYNKNKISRKDWILILIHTKNILDYSHQ
jgi:hypothetical protein